MNDFYGTGIMEEQHLDRFKYKGRGRPKASDYSPINVIQRGLNELFNKVLDKKGIKHE